MKKLLCIVCLLATVLFVNAANASLGSPVRNGRGSVSVGTVRVAAACTTCGAVSVRPVVTPIVRRPVVRPVVVRPVVSACTTCGHSFGHRHAFHGRRSFGHRHFGHRHFGHRHFGHRHFGHRHFGRRHSFHHRRFACTRCGR